MFGFFEKIFDFLNNSITYIINLIIYLFNFVIWLFCKLVNFLVDIFPNTPFDVSELTFGNEKYFGYLNWIFPLDVIVNITFVWGGCMLVYWGYGVVMRYIKLID